jgi:hypothetical protein
MHLPLHTNTTRNTLPITYLIFLWQQASLSIDQSVHICAQVGFNCGSARAAVAGGAISGHGAVPSAPLSPVLGSLPPTPSCDKPATRGMDAITFTWNQESKGQSTLHK